MILNYFFLFSREMTKIFYLIQDLHKGSNLLIDLYSFNQSAYMSRKIENRSPTEQIMKKHVYCFKPTCPLCFFNFPKRATVNTPFIISHNSDHSFLHVSFLNYLPCLVDNELQTNKYKYKSSSFITSHVPCLFDCIYSDAFPVAQQLR